MQLQARHAIRQTFSDPEACTLISSARFPATIQLSVSSHDINALFCCRFCSSRPSNTSRFTTACLSNVKGPSPRTFGGQLHGVHAPSHSTTRRTLRASAFNIDNRELIVGDLLAIVCFCLYKQVSIPTWHPLKVSRPIVAPYSTLWSAVDYECGNARPCIMCRSRHSCSCQIFQDGWRLYTSMQVEICHRSRCVWSTSRPCRSSTGCLRNKQLVKQAYRKYLRLQ